MTETKYTPGPWLWHWAENHLGHADGRIHTDPKTNVITGHAVCVAVSPRLQSKAQWEVDARLISAAPDLLEALTELLEVVQATRGFDDDDFSETKEWCHETCRHPFCNEFGCIPAKAHRARQAIAKATAAQALPALYPQERAP